jgi:hypothetical protein
MSRAGFRFRVSCRTLARIRQDPEGWAEALRRAGLPGWTHPDLEWAVRTGECPVFFRVEDPDVAVRLQQAFARMSAPCPEGEVPPPGAGMAPGSGEPQVGDGAGGQNVPDPFPGQPDPEGEEEEGVLLQWARRRWEGIAGQSWNARGVPLASPEDLRRVDPDLASRLAAVFRQAAWKGAARAEGRGQPGPRWDPRRVAARVAGYLRPVGPESRRRELGRPRVLVLVDVSTSMAGVVDEFLPVAVAAAAALGEGARLIATDNGDPYLVPEGNRVRTYYGLGPDRSWSMYREWLRQWRITAVLLLGDAQNLWLARRLAAARLDVYWIDNYLASRGREKGRPFVVPFPPRWMAERLFPPHLQPADEDDPRRWPPPWRRRIRYAFGVGDADLAVAALERMLRG